MPIRAKALLSALLALGVVGSAFGAMYRWVDENGITVYSQSPPPGGESVKLRKQPGPRAEDAQAARERVEQQREQVFDDGEARTEAATERAKEEDEDKRRAENCEAARKNLYKYQNLGRRMVFTPNGVAERLSEDEVQTRIEKAQMQVDEFCN